MLALLAGIHPAAAQTSFVLSTNYPVNAAPFNLSAADVNGDGKVDLISVNPDDETITVLTNNGSGGFGLKGKYPAGHHPVMITSADVNGDGKIDVIAANWGNSLIGYGNTLTVLTNDGSGGFVIASSPVVGNSPYCVCAADVNNDGKPDLISANFFDATLSVLTNNGSGGFVSSGTYPVANGTYAVTAADINGDGRVDLICANVRSSDGYGNTLTVLTNNGSGGFGFNAAYTVGNQPNANGSDPVAVVAFTNEDGLVDLACANAD